MKCLKLHKDQRKKE